MGKFKYFVPILILVLFAFCTANTNQRDEDLDLSEIDFVGKWKNTMLNSSDLDNEIESIVFVNDSIAEVNLIESDEEKKKIGSWKYQSETEIVKKVGWSLESDLQVEFKQDDQHSIILAFKIKEIDNKLRLIGHKMEFEKE